MSTTINLTITGMSCNGCVSNAEAHLKAVDGVEDVTVTLEDGQAVVTGNANSGELITAIKAAGYEAVVAG